MKLAKQWLNFTVFFIITAFFITAVALAGTAERIPEKSDTSFTLFIYMNGSDLESRYKLATYNLAEMLSGFSGEGDFTVLIMTGGTESWHSANINPASITYLRLDKNRLTTIKELPVQSIGSARTLAEFISYGLSCAPADRYGLIFWNHGAGSVRGFGKDELFNKDSLTGPEIREGLTAGLNGTKLSFIGFDACLMATAEVADACSEYAEYMIASQELEPGGGWDYRRIFQLLSKNPGIDTASLCKTIVDTYIDVSVAENPGEYVTLSVLDLAKIQLVAEALGKLADKVSDKIYLDGFSGVSDARRQTKDFGSPSLNNAGWDMIDAVNLAEHLADMFPSESMEVYEAVSDAVVYAKNSPNVQNANGMSVYFPYKNKKLAEALESYLASGFNGKYLSMIGQVADKLLKINPARPPAPLIRPDEKKDLICIDTKTLPDIIEFYAVLFQQDKDKYRLLGLDSDADINFKQGLLTARFNREWVSINGITVAVYAIKHTDEIILYSVPALLNGEEVELILFYDDDNPCGAVLGARRISDVPDKGFMPIKTGDEVVFLYEVFNAASKTTPDEKIRGEKIVFDGDFLVDVEAVPAGRYLYGFCLLDIYYNKHYSNFIELSVEKKANGFP